MIDWKRVAELRDEVGEDGFDEIIELFLEEVESIIDLFRDETGVDQLEAHMHFLKGSALNLGFQNFADLCQNGEILAEQGQGDEIELRAVVECYDLSRADFMAQIAQKFAA